VNIHIILSIFSDQQILSEIKKNMNVACAAAIAEPPQEQCVTLPNCFQGKYLKEEHA
jgi:hypothetical protein